MRSRLFLLVAVTLLALAALIAGLFFNVRQPAPSSLAIANGAEPVDPLNQEMDCIEGVLSNNRLEANQIQPALDACR